MKGWDATLKLLDNTNINIIRDDTKVQATLLKATSDAAAKQLMKAWTQYTAYKDWPDKELSTLLANFEGDSSDSSDTLRAVWSEQAKEPESAALQKVRQAVAANMLIQGLFRRSGSEEQRERLLAQAKARAEAIISIADLLPTVQSLLNRVPQAAAPREVPPGTP